MHTGINLMPKIVRNTANKETYRLILQMNIQVNILNKANKIQQHIKNNQIKQNFTHYDQMGFIPGIKVFNICRSIDKTYYINRMSNKITGSS